jgi:hypothetical protein
MLFGALKNNRGAAMIVYTFMFVAMLGMAAVAVDTGSVAVQRQKLQKAVDAAALAAAQYLPDTGAARNAAKRYAELNGFSPEDISVTFADSNKTVAVNANRRLDYTFARVLGIDGTDVTLGAKAMSGSMGGAFNYALFSGSKTALFMINGSSYTITGSTHGNQNFATNGSSVLITGNCEAVGTVTVNGSDMHIDHRVPGSPYIAMPDFADMIKQQAEAVGQVYHGDKAFNGSSIDLTRPVYVDGNVTINGSKFNGTGFLLATGNITFNGSSIKMSSTDSVCVYSENGNIQVNGATVEMEGVLYAPKGMVQFNGSSITLRGRAIANTISINIASFTAIAGSHDLDCLPTSYVKLIR